MKKRLTVSLLFLLGISLFAQKDNRLLSGLNPLSEVPQVVMPAQNNAALQTVEASRRGYETAPRYAVNLNVDIDPENTGSWETSTDGKSVWRLRIKSPRAYSINLGFSQYKMPTGGELFLYSPDYKQVLGPFTPADNEEHEQLWTPILQGDELVIEVQLPMTQRSALDLKLDYVNHAFQDFSALISGSCNLDVICSAADGFGIVDGYRDIIQSVAVISTGGGTFCTGFLVNNVQEDCKPFFMTANHCGINSGNAASLVTYWNFQNSSCRQPNSPSSGSGGDGQLNDFNTGAIFRAARSNSDFTLVELDDPVSPTANAFFAGWDATASLISSAIGVHHPSTDEKRISFDDDPLQFTTYSSGTPTANFNHVQIIDWNIGTTEPGSSGSPLFDQDKRVVGQLHGGGAACGNNDSDWYGAFATSWDAGNTASSRLKDWLDPANTGTMIINGRYASSCTFSVIATPNIVTVCSPLDALFSLSVSEAFNTTVSLSASDLPSGATADFSPSNVIPGGSSSLTISTDGVLPGTYFIFINGTDGSNTSQDIITLIVLDGTNAIPELIDPLNNSTDIFPNPVLSWDGDNSGMTNYEIEIALDANFNTIVETANTNNLNYQTINVGNGLTTYYWRVKATSPCGSSNFSAAYQFFTSNINCTTYSSTSSSTISEVGTPLIENDIFVGDDNTIGTIIVALDVTHTYVGDLDASLLSPTGQNILLFDRPGFPNSDFGCSEDNLQLFLSPDGLSSSNNLENTCNESSESNSYAIEGSFQAVGNLNNLSELSSLGLWTLQMNDNAAADGGVLNSWSLTVCFAVEGSPPAIITNNTLEVARGSEETISSTYLQVTDNESNPSDLFFTLVNSPIQGDLLLNGSVINQGEIFTQADINNGLISYAHNGGIVLNDEFEFDVADGSGLELTGNTFLIDITVSAMNASLQLTNISLCHGDMDAALMVIISGGLPPYQYALNEAPFQVFNSFENLDEGDYFVTVLDALGNTANTPTFSITEPQELIVSTTVDENEITVMTSGGIIPYSYQINGGSSQSNNVFSNLSNGLYSIMVTDANDCTTTTNVTIAVNTLDVNAILINDISCFNLNDASISAIVNGGTAPFEYQLNEAAFQNENAFSDLEAGIYQITVRDSEGFLSTTSEITVTNPSELTIATSTDINTINATAEGGTPPLEFNINGGNNQASGQFENLPNGAYTVAVIDANDCIAITNITIAVNTLDVNAVLINDISCHDFNDASISAVVNGGTVPFQYQLNEGLFQNEDTFSDLEAGIYQITVRDSEGFLFTTSELTVTNPSELTIAANSNINTINATAEGGTPPLEFNINGGNNQASGQFENLPNGAYTVTVIDTNDCATTTNITIAVNTLNVSAILINDISCHDFNDASINAAVNGGTTPFEYQLNEGAFQDEDTFSDLETGIYQVTVRDSEGFLFTTSEITVTNPSELTIATSTDINTINATAEGGTPSLEFNINGGNNQASGQFENLPNGVYTVAVIDANDCIATTDITIAVNTLNVNAILINDISCFNLNDASISAIVNGGTAPFEYQLNDGAFQDEDTFSDLETGIYQITVKDSEGFLFTTSEITVTNPPNLTISASVDNNTINAVAEGGTPPLFFNINGGNPQIGGQFENLINGMHNVTVIDGNGCVETTTVTINSTALVVNNINAHNVSCHNANDGNITVEVSGGVPPYEYSLDGVNFQTENTFINLGPGSYSLTIRDAEGTIVMPAMLNITNPPELILSLEFVDNILFAQAIGGTGNHLFRLDNGEYGSQDQFSDVENGVHEIFVIDENDCISSDTISILVGLFEVFKPSLNFNLFPNPNQGQFQLLINQSTAKNLHCYIYNIAGELIMQKTFEKPQNLFEIDFDLRLFPSGMYEVLLTDGYLLGVGRVIVQE